MKKPTVAIYYDFDGTLSPKNMQEFGFFHGLEEKERKSFWAQSNGKAAETLMGKHRSCPLNPDIANTFFRAGYIESWGRVVEKICRICHNYGIPDPEYTVHPNDIMLCFKTDSHKAQEDSGHTENHTENTVDTILKILADEPRVTIARLCEMTRKSRSTITDHIAKLKAMNRIRRVGPDKGGHWEVVHG